MDHAVGYMMRLLSSLTEPAIAHSLVRGAPHRTALRGPHTAPQRSTAPPAQAAWQPAHAAVMAYTCL